MNIYKRFKYLKFLTKEKIDFLILLTLEIIPTNHFSIRDYYGRLGNNLQQIANGIAYSEIYDKSFSSKEHSQIKVIRTGTSKSVFKKKYRFFHYREIGSINRDTPKNTALDYNEINPRMHRIFQEKILPNIKFYKKIDIPNDTLVIHLRSGDIFEKAKYFDQVQNPLNFYLEVIKNYKNILIVTSQEKNNPVLSYLENLPNCNIEIQSKSVNEDFNTLLNARNLCLSGIGTFGVAAALLSTNLKKLYFSNIYLRSHLNPEMVDIKKVDKIEYKIENYYNAGKWSTHEEVIDSMLDERVKIEKI
jgi:hypothetical protein